MSQTTLNDAVVFQHLFNDNLDRFLFCEIEKKHIFVCKDGFSVKKNTFSDEIIIKRLKNYIETGIVLSDEKFIHTKNFDTICTDCKNNSPLTLSEMGKLVVSKIKFD